MSVYVLDACALIAVFTHETGFENVSEIINSNSEVYMHKVNLLEVYYDLYRAYGEERADEVISFFVGDSGVKIISDISDDIFKAAGRLKATYKISFADSFALAVALTNRGKLVTSDHHEFESLEKTENIEFFWYR